MPQHRGRTTVTDQLFDAVLDLRTIEECERFFEDLGTLKEISHLSHRLEAARLLHSRATYEQAIVATRKALGREPVPRTATLRRIHPFVHDRAGGYRPILYRIAPRLPR